MATKTLDEKQVRTVIAVFEELNKMRYEELNKFLGSITIQEMNELYWDLMKWYKPEAFEEEV